jgi:hypothetical protein
MTSAIKPALSSKAPSETGADLHPGHDFLGIPRRRSQSAPTSRALIFLAQRGVELTVPRQTQLAAPRRFFKSGAGHFHLRRILARQGHGPEGIAQFPCVFFPDSIAIEDSLITVVVLGRRTRENNHGKGYNLGLVPSGEPRKPWGNCVKSVMNLTECRTPSRLYWVVSPVLPPFRPRFCQPTPKSLPVNTLNSAPRGPEDFADQQASSADGVISNTAAFSRAAMGRRRRSCAWGLPQLPRL